MERPNVLYILVDDLGWGDVSYHGSLIRTPNMDRLVSRGIELDYHYVNPVCTPTRASLLTGRFPGRFGQHATVPSNPPVLPDGYYTLASLFRDAGYATALFGKWHLGSEPRFCPNNYGFDYSYGTLAGGVDPYRHFYKTGAWSKTWHCNGVLQDFEPGHITDLLTDRAIRWIREQDKPWFCYMPYTAVHSPVRAPEEWLDKYWFEHYDPEPNRERSFKEYAAYTGHLDYNIGRLIEALKCYTAECNTLVIFVSDNGASTKDLSADTNLYPGWHEDMPRNGSNYPLRGTKATMYEGGIRTPAALMWQSVLQPGKLSIPLHVTDWMPTFAAMLGVEPPVDPQWDGTNIWPVIAGDSTDEPDRPICWNLRHIQFAVRDHGWKLIRRYQGDRTETELYHIAADPLENHDLVAAQPAEVARLEAILAEQRKRDDSSKRSDVD